MRVRRLQNPGLLNDEARSLKNYNRNCTAGVAEEISLSTLCIVEEEDKLLVSKLGTDVADVEAAVCRRCRARLLSLVTETLMLEDVAALSLLLKHRVRLLLTAYMTHAELCLWRLRSDSYCLHCSACSACYAVVLMVMLNKLMLHMMLLLNQRRKPSAEAGAVC